MAALPWQVKVPMGTSFGMEQRRQSMPLCAIKVSKTSDPEDPKYEDLMYSRVKSATGCLFGASCNQGKTLPHLAFAY